MKLPEMDFDIDEPDAFAVLAGLFTLDVGAKMAGARAPSTIWAVASIYVFGAAILLLFAGTTSIDIRKYGRPLAGFAFLAIMVGVGVTYLMIHGTPMQTDVLFFINEGASTLLHGQSPYTASFDGQTVFPTPLMNGETVSQFSYPLGGILMTIPFAPLVPDASRVATVVATAGLGAIMIGSAPHELAPLALIGLLTSNFVTWGVNGLMGALWLLPLVGSMYYWPYSAVGRNSLRWSAVLLGVSAAVKQFPWFVGPFLLLWLGRDRDWRTAGEYAMMSVGVFTLLNLPALVMSPGAAVEGILTPLLGDGGAMVHLGVGLSALTLSGLAPVAKSVHTVLLVAVAVAYLAAYWRFEQLRWTAWIAWTPILFVNYRSLMTYFVAAAPVAVYALICRGDLGLEAQEVADAA